MPAGQVWRRGEASWASIGHLAPTILNWPNSEGKTAVSRFT